MPKMYFVEWYEDYEDHGVKGPFSTKEAAIKWAALSYHDEHSCSITVIDGFVDKGAKFVNVCGLNEVMPIVEKHRAEEERKQWAPYLHEADDGLL